MMLTKDQIKTARANAADYMMTMTVKKGDCYWTPRKIDMLFHYALKSIGATVADAWETMNAAGRYDDTWDIGFQIGVELAWHLRWCGRRVKRAPYPRYC